MTTRVRIALLAGALTLLPVISAAQYVTPGEQSEGHSGNVSTFNIRNLQLGMTLDEVRRLHGAAISDVQQESSGTMSLGYSARMNSEIALRFTSDAFGARLYEIVLSQPLGSSLQKDRVLEQVKAKYGLPNCENFAASDRWRSWGACGQVAPPFTHVQASGQYLELRFRQNAVELRLSDAVIGAAQTERMVAQMQRMASGTPTSSGEVSSEQVARLDF